MGWLVIEIAVQRVVLATIQRIHCKYACTAHSPPFRICAIRAIQRCAFHVNGTGVAVEPQLQPALFKPTAAVESRDNGNW